MEIIEDFKQSWTKNNKQFSIDEPFPVYIVDIAGRIKNFMLEQNRGYQGALGNARGMLDAVKAYCNQATITDPEKFATNIDLIFEFLLKVRLTSQVPLNTAFFIKQKLKQMNPATRSVDELKAELCAQCDFHLKNYGKARDRIANHMSTRIIDRCEEYDQEAIVIGTHCHSGAVIKAIIKSKEHVKHVVVSKTEPEQQGVITAKELVDAGVKVRFITLEQYGMEFRRVNMFLFGIDAVSIEGTVLNKAGTRMIATLALTKDLPVYFLGETYKYARDTLYGGLIRVERRDVTEHLLHNHVSIDLHPYVEKGMLDASFSAFDTTKPEYYDSIVSEMGFLPMKTAFELAWKDYLD